MVHHDIGKETCIDKSNLELKFHKLKKKIKIKKINFIKYSPQIHDKHSILVKLNNLVY